MKKVGWGILLLLFTATAFAQTLIPKEKKKKWGYVNIAKDFVIQPVFEEAGYFSNSSAIVKMDGEYKLINKQGAFLNTPKHGSLYRSGSFIYYRVGSKHGILDSLGNQITEPLFEKIDSHFEGDFTVKLDGKWVYWTVGGGIRETEDLVFANPDGYPLFGEKCSKIKDVEEIKECSNMALLRAIYKNVRYPATARERGIMGTVVIRFIINSDGSISDVELLRDIGGGCGEEAIRVAKKLKIFRVPTMEGAPVRMRFALPVKFKLV